MLHVLHRCFKRVLRQQRHRVHRKGQILSDIHIPLLQRSHKSFLAFDKIENPHFRLDVANASVPQSDEMFPRLITSKVVVNGNKTRVDMLEASVQDDQIRMDR